MPPNHSPPTPPTHPQTPLPYLHRITRQILQCLILLEKNEIIHCDLKPENILYVGEPTTADIRVIDFGSSCATTGQSK